MSSPIIVWHYRDLRIDDNPALHQAALENRVVIPVYIHSPKDEGHWARGAASNWWLHHSLSSLSEEYKKRYGTSLMILKGKAEEVLESLIKEHSVSGVYWNRRYEPSICARDRKLYKELKAEGIQVETFEGNYLISPKSILNKSDKPYTVYTPFSKVLFKLQDWRSPLPAPSQLHTHALSSLPLESLNLLPQLDWADPFSDLWKPGRQGALEQLESFSSPVEEYKEKRDFPAEPGTSRLSPHLHFGELSPHEVWQRFSSAFPYQRQLLWREFGNYFLYHQPTFTDFSWKSSFEDFPWETEKKDLLTRWQQGQTGYPIVDAGMRELWQTGWMHNRVRMIVASFLIKDLFVHWIEGARWFWDTLVDADLANNSLGWQWVAGCGPDAAPYFRIFNPILQGKKFDPEGHYVRRWVPELESVPLKFLHNPWEAPFPPSLYPPPMVDHAQARTQALEAYSGLSKS